VTSGPHKGQTLALGATAVVVGREGTASRSSSPWTLPLDDSLEPKHCKVGWGRRGDCSS
jgi:hypothetical protein